MVSILDYGTHGTKGNYLTEKKKLNHAGKIRKTISLVPKCFYDMVLFAVAVILSFQRAAWNKIGLTLLDSPAARLNINCFLALVHWKMVLLFLLSAVIALAEQSIEASVGPFPNLFFSGMTITALISSACSDVEKLWIPVAGGGQGGVETA